MPHQDVVWQQPWGRRTWWPDWGPPVPCTGNALLLQQPLGGLQEHMEAKLLGQMPAATTGGPLQ